MSLNLPSDLVHDIRQPILGDSFNWEAIEPGAAKKSIVIHATASEGVNEDGFTMADYHVNHNGWGGIGVHFVVTKDGYPGKPQFGLPAGAQVQYVGDLYTWRAGVANSNPGRIHIEISGLFTPGHGVPSEAQLRKTRALIEHLLTHTPELPSLNYWSQVTYHNAVATPGNGTECPGWQHPQFHEWMGYLQGGAEPSWFARPVPVAPVVVTPPPAPAPEWVSTFVEGQQTLTVKRPGAQAVDVTTGAKVADIAVGTSVTLAGTFTSGGQHYGQTVWAHANHKPNGILMDAFAEPPVEVPVTVVPSPTPEPGMGSGEPPQMTEEQARAAFLGLDQADVVSIRQKLWDVLALVLVKLHIIKG